MKPELSRPRFMDNQLDETYGRLILYMVSAARLLYEHRMIEMEKHWNIYNGL